LALRIITDERGDDADLSGSSLRQEEGEMMELRGKNFAEAFPPADFIKEELEARGWSQADLAAIMGRAPNVISEVLSGRRSITNKTAEELGEAFGTGAEYWLNLQAAYEAYKLRGAGDQGSAVARKARLYGKAPVREMIRRRWIQPSDDVSNLEAQVCKFLGISSLDDESPYRACVFRTSSPYSKPTPAQQAWLCCAHHLSRKLTPKEVFSDQSLELTLQRIPNLLTHVSDVRKVPTVLAEGGIRFVVVEALPGTKIDGACFWLDDNSPVIAITLRYDRIDWFWQTIGHELRHVKNRDGIDEAAIDTDLVGRPEGTKKDKPEREKQADQFAAQLLVPQDKLDRFIARVRPYYSKDRIRAFASQIRVHPGIVVGQLQFREEITYAQNREMLEKVRAIIAESESVLMDGWGSAALAA